MEAVMSKMSLDTTAISSTSRRDVFTKVLTNSFIKFVFTLITFTVFRDLLVEC